MSVKAQKNSQSVWLLVWLRPKHSTHNVHLMCCKEIKGTKMKWGKKKTKEKRTEETLKYDVGEILESFIKLQRKVVA